MIVIPLAGESKRFQSVGITQPKWSLRIGTQSILELATRSILNSLLVDEILLYIVKKADIHYLIPITEAFSDQRIRIAQLNHATTGQAESVLIGIDSFENDKMQRLVIWCGDSAYKENSFDFSNYTDNWIAVSKLKGSHWSFVKVIGDAVIRTSEKIKISELASIGLYGFSSIADFRELKPIERDPSYSEAFVAPLYNKLIEIKKKVRSEEISEKNFYPLGTPEEVLKTCLRLDLDVPKELRFLNSLLDLG